MGDCNRIIKLMATGNEADVYVIEKCLIKLCKGMLGLLASTNRD